MSRVTLAAALLASAVVVAAPAPAHAAPDGTTVSFDLGATAPRDLAIDGATAFVSVGDAVHVYTLSGSKVATIPRLPGVGDLLLSADHRVLYAAISGGSGIAVIDTGTRTVTDTIPTPPCPTSMAIAQGRAFVAHGCDHADTAVTSVSLSDDTPGPVLDARYYGAVTLSAGADVLAVADAESAPSQTGTYRVDAAGTFTALASSRLSQARDLAVSPDGTQLVATRYDGAGYGVERWDTATMTQLPGMTTEAYPSAVAWSADGTRILAGTSSEHPFWLFESSGVQLHRAAAPDRVDLLLPGTLNLDGTTMAALAEDYSDGDYRLLVASTTPPAATRLTVTTTSAARPGAKVTVAVSANRPRTPVVLSVDDGFGPRSATVRTDGSGRAVYRFAGRTSGTVTASVAGDLEHTAATSAARRFTVGALLSGVLSGSYRTDHGVRLFHRAGDVRPIITFKPARTAVLTVRLQVLSGTRWTTIQTQRFSTDSGGRLPLTFQGAPRTVYRLVAGFTGDQWNSRAPDIASKAFALR